MRGFFMSETTENPVVPEPKSKSAKGNVPMADIDLVTTAKNVAEKWKSTPNLTLIWSDSNRLIQIAADYENTLNVRIAEGSRRPEVSAKLKNLDKQIDLGIGYIKDYLRERYGNDDKAHYSQYGIVFYSKTYKLPSDRDTRASSFTLILEALNRDGFNDKSYGRSYWENIRDQYIPIKQEAVDMDEAVAGKVSEKNLLKDEIKKHLYALIDLLKANYPDTYKSEMRVWGFQKEKY
jgi:hypothetical protein